MINVGDSAEAGFTVQWSDTAQALALSADDSFPEVLATSRMIALMEIAAARVLKPELRDGQLSVGVSVNYPRLKARASDLRLKPVRVGLAADCLTQS